jgi:hypothetical protein
MPKRLTISAVSHATKKKSRAQLDREIAEALTQPLRATTQEEYTRSYSPEDVLDYLLGAPGHQGEDPDWVESVESTIFSWDSWVRMGVPLEKLLLMSVNARAKKYARLRTPFPPIIVFRTRHDDFEVLDGNARANAARLRGDRCITAYVPDRYAERLTGC